MIRPPRSSAPPPARALWAAPIATVLIVVPILIAPSALSAQFSPLGFENTVSLQVSPRYPEPDARVTLTLSSTYFDLSASAITWYVDGDKQPTEGDRSLTIDTGPSGRVIAVSVVVENSEGTAEANARIIPAEVDLLAEANTFTPPFYSGRARASAGSTVTLQALPRLVPPGAGAIPAEQLNFTWRRNGDVLGSLSGRGRQTLTIPAPLLFGADTISVEVVSTDKTIGAETSISINTQDPELVLYFEDPRYGVLYGRALGSLSVVNEREAVFVAVPYFAPVRSSADASLRYAWRVNRTEVLNDGPDPHKITIDAANSSGLALIELAITHATNFFIEATERWNVTFEAENDFASPLIPTPGSAF